MQQLLPRECGDHLLLVALVLPVPVVGAAQVDAEEARTDAQPLLGDGDLILLVALVLTVLAVSVQGDVEEARLAAEDQEFEEILNISLYKPMSFVFST